jgi:RNA-directed DNA polymerase
MVFEGHISQPVEEVIEELNPVLRGWVNYFNIGDSSRCFSFVQNWVEEKLRRHLARNTKRRGIGWKRWNRAWLYKKLGLFGEYRLRYYPARLKALSVR